MESWQVSLLIASGVLFGITLGWALADILVQRDAQAISDKAITEHEASLRQAEVDYIRGLAADSVERGDFCIGWFPITSTLTYEQAVEVAREAQVEFEWQKVAPVWGKP